MKPQASISSNNLHIQRQENFVDLQNESLLEYRDSETLQFKLVVVFIGLVVTVPYTIFVAYSVENMAHFGYENLGSVGFVAISSLAFLAKIIHANYMLVILHRNRALFFGVLSAGGLLLGTLSYQMNDKIAVVALLTGGIFIGIANTLQESLILGFAKVGSPTIISWYFFGSALSLLVSFSALLLKFVNIQYPTVSFIIALSMIPYYISMRWLINHTLDFIKKDSRDTTELDMERNETRSNIQLNLKTLRVTFKLLWYDFLNLGVVFYLEYIILSSLFDRANPHSTNSENFAEKNIVMILMISYNSGVSCSKLSLVFFKIDRVGLLSILQLINWIIYLTAAIWKWIPFYYQIPICVYIGLMGGLIYGNIFYRIRTNKILNKNIKELCTNVGTLIYDVCILLANPTGMIISVWLIPNRANAIEKLG